MMVLEVLIIVAALVAVVCLLSSLILTQVRDYHFYKANDWDFSVDSGHDKLRLDNQILPYYLNLSPWQRFYVFRPLYILNIACFLGFMVWSLF